MEERQSCSSNPGLGIQGTPLCKDLSERILHVSIPEAEDQGAEERGNDSVRNSDECVISSRAFWLQIHNSCETKVDDDHGEMRGTGRKGLLLARG